MKKKSAKWVVAFLALYIGALVVLGGVTVLVDPYFHYHAPISFAKYELKEQRYQNNGILKNFDYDAIITGTSMTECFEASELNQLFGVTTVKVPFAGASYREINEQLQDAFAHNSGIRMVVRAIDMDVFFEDADKMSYTDYPEYLYDENPFNDVSYVFNKNVLLKSIQHLHGYMSEKSNGINFNAYSNWSNYATYGRDAILSKYNGSQLDVEKEPGTISEEEYAMMEKNISQNITTLAVENPDTDFYLCFSPYSIYFYDFWNRRGVLEKYLLAEQFYIEQLLPYENIHVYSFTSAFDVICNPDNYKDPQHHSGAINSMMLQCMKTGEYEVTAENYDEHCRVVYDFYMNYDYDGLYEE